MYGSAKYGSTKYGAKSQGDSIKVTALIAIKREINFFVTLLTTILRKIAITYRDKLPSNNKVFTDSLPSKPAQWADKLPPKPKQWKSKL